MRKQDPGSTLARVKSALILGLTLLTSTPGRAQAPAFDPFEATIPQIRAALSSGSITCKQLVQFYFDRMDALDIAGPKLNAIRVRNSKALQIADAMDHLNASTPRGPLFCIPINVGSACRKALIFIFTK